jgi:ribosomal-protein-alanine N-acetyltransferase
MSAVLRPETWFDALGEDDLDAVMAIERAIYPFPWTSGNFRDSIRAGYHCIAHRSRRELIGYAIVAVAAGEAHLLNLSVAQAQQRQGHGERLLGQVIRSARAHGAEMLFLEVRPSNQAARRLYRRHGFSRIGVRRDYYPAGHGREDALVLSLSLTPAA